MLFLCQHRILSNYISVSLYTLSLATLYFEWVIENNHHRQCDHEPVHVDNSVTWVNPQSEILCCVKRVRLHNRSGLILEVPPPSDLVLENPTRFYIPLYWSAPISSSHSSSLIITLLMSPHSLRDPREYCNEWHLLLKTAIPISSITNKDM